MKTRFLFLFLLAVLVTSCSAFSDKKDDELAACPEGQTLTAGACVTIINPSVSCAAASDCQNGMICQSGACVQAPAVAGCADNSQCTDGKICVSGVCVASAATGCTDNSQCEAGKVCTDGSCVASAAVPECTDANPCTDGRTCVDGVCVASHAETGCDEDIDCDSGEACTAGECVAVATLCNADGCVEVPTRCGNGTCDTGESHASCPADCAEVATTPACGNGTCDVSESRASCPADCSRVITEDMRQGVIPCPAGFERNRGGTCVATGGAGVGVEDGANSESSVIQLTEGESPLHGLEGIQRSISSNHQALIDAGLCHPQKYDDGDHRIRVQFVIILYSEPNYQGDYIRFAGQDTLYGGDPDIRIPVGYLRTGDGENWERSYGHYYAGSMKILKGPNYVNESRSKRDKVRIEYGINPHYFTFNGPRNIPDMSAVMGSDGITRNMTWIWSIDFVEPGGLNSHKCAEISDQNDELKWHHSIPVIMKVIASNWPSERPNTDFQFDVIKKTNFDRLSGGRASPNLFDNKIFNVAILPGPDVKSNNGLWEVRLYDGAFNDLLYAVKVGEMTYVDNFSLPFTVELREISSIDIIPPP